MSGVALKWARRQRIGSLSLKALVNAIAARADQKGTTWASQATLAEELGATDRHVRGLLSTLEQIGVITRTMRSGGRNGRLSDVITLSLHRDFDLSARNVKAAKQAASSGTKVPVEADSSKRNKSGVPTGTKVPLEADISNRNKSGVPTGTRVPGNSKGTTYPIQEGKLPIKVSAYAKATALAGGEPTWDEDDPFGANVVPLRRGVA